MVSDSDVALLREEVRLLRELIQVKERLIALRTLDVHAYRDAIDPRCRIGTCSMNNCLYPDCVSP